jgi:hypothetical protein
MLLKYVLKTPKPDVESAEVPVTAPEAAPAPLPSPDMGAAPDMGAVPEMGGETPSPESDMEMPF